MGQQCCKPSSQLTEPPLGFSPQGLLDRHPPGEGSEGPILQETSLPPLSPQVLDQLEEGDLCPRDLNFETQFRGLDSGTFLLADGSVYQGQIKGSHLHGRGNLHFPDGSIFQGYFFLSQPVKSGASFTPWGLLHQGASWTTVAQPVNFTLDLQEGFPLLKVSEFAPLLQGPGIMTVTSTSGMNHPTYRAGSVYKGPFLNSMPHTDPPPLPAPSQPSQALSQPPLPSWSSLVNNPPGQLSSPGETHYGHFLYSLLQSVGAHTFTQGRTYLGGWKQGQFHGFGRFDWGDGRCYEGQYLRGLKHGQGTFVFSNGDVYNGQWKEGRQDGPGEIIKVGGVPQKGIWKEGVQIDGPEIRPPFNASSSTPFVDLNSNSRASFNHHGISGRESRPSLGLSPIPSQVPSQVPSQRVSHLPSLSGGRPSLPADLLSSPLQR